MQLNEKHKKFIKNNKDILIEIFNIRLNELVDTASELNPLAADFSQKAGLNLLFIREFRDWIRHLTALSNPTKTEKTSNKDYI